MKAQNSNLRTRHSLFLIALLTILTTTIQVFAAARYSSDGQTAVRRAPADFNGDGKTDFALIGAARSFGLYPNPFQEVWYIQPNNYPSAPAANSNYQAPFGLINPTNQAQSDFPVPEDYDGDGKADIAVWRGSGGSSSNANLSYFYVLRSSDNTFSPLQFGQPGDSPRLSGDYDGDGKADIAFYRQNTKSFYIAFSGVAGSAAYGFSDHSAHRAICPSRLTTRLTAPLPRRKNFGRDEYVKKFVSPAPRRIRALLPTL